MWCAVLAQAGYRIRVAVRRPDLAHFLQPLGNVGQIHPMQANLRYRWSVDRAVEGADTVVNLVGILQQTGRQKYDTLHGFGARAVAEAARGVGRASGAFFRRLAPTPHSLSNYGMSKAQGEVAVRETIKNATILRPSIIFGPEDDFFNRFAAMARLSPILPLIGGGHTRFQPVFVGDVAEAVSRAVEGVVRSGITYELGGPDIMTFRECLELIMAETGRSRMLMPLPWWLASTIGRVGDFVPGAPITRDQVLMLKHDNVVGKEAIRAKRTLAGIGIQPASVHALVPQYLARFRASGQFHHNRTA